MNLLQIYNSHQQVWMRESHRLEKPSPQEHAPSGLSGVIAQCREVCLQNVANKITHDDIQQFVANVGIIDQLETWQLEGSFPRRVTFMFKTAKQALNFYLTRNFLEEIQGRVVNAFLDLHPAPSFINSYRLYGVTQEKQRKTFDILKVHGLCRLDIYYKKWFRVKPCSANVTFVKEGGLTFEEICEITMKLQQLNVSITAKDSQDFSMKTYINLHQLKNGKKSQAKEERASSVLEKVAASAGMKMDRDVKQFISQDEKAQSLTTLLVCRQSSQTERLFKKLEEQTFFAENKVDLTFKQGAREKSSFDFLFSKTLLDIWNRPEKEFERIVEKRLCRISRKIVGIELTKILRKDLPFSKYYGMVCFDTEESGIEFLATYCEHLDELKDLYDNGSVCFERKLTKEELQSYRQQIHKEVPMTHPKNKEKVKILSKNDNEIQKGEFQKKQPKHPQDSNKPTFQPPFNTMKPPVFQPPFVPMNPYTFQPQPVTFPPMNPMIPTISVPPRVPMNPMTSMNVQTREFHEESYPQSQTRKSYQENIMKNQYIPDYNHFPVIEAEDCQSLSRESSQTSRPLKKKQYVEKKEKRT